MESNSLLKIKITSYKSKSLAINLINTMIRRYATSLYQIGNVKEYFLASVHMSIMAQDFSFLLIHFEICIINQTKDDLYSNKC